MSAAYAIESWSPEGRATHREISQRSGGVRGHLDLFIQPEACANRSIGKTCEWCDTREAAIEAALIGIGRELAQWQPFEHRCFSREADGGGMLDVCPCGSWPVLNASALDSDLNARMHRLFERRWLQPGPSTWTARPGTTVEVRR